MRAYQQAVTKIREGALAMQHLDNQRNLAAFLARQQRIKARQSNTQGANNSHALTSTLAPNDKEAHHV